MTFTSIYFNLFYYFSLMVEIQKLYADSDENKITADDCSIGKSYAVYSNVQKQWYRGTVLSKEDDENVKVSLVIFLSKIVIELLDLLGSCAY